MEFEVEVTGDTVDISFREQKHKRYKAQETADGIIIFVPGALVPSIVPEGIPDEPYWKTSWLKER